MRCRSCGTEIADKALICYRCGTPTTEAKFKPASVGRRRKRPRAAVLAAILLLVAVVLLLVLMHFAK